MPEKSCCRKVMPFPYTAPNFRAHALKFKHNKVEYTNYVKFRMQSMSFKTERAFEKTIKYVLFFIFTNSNFNLIFYRFFPLFFFYNSYP